MCLFLLMFLVQCDTSPKVNGNNSDPPDIPSTPLTMEKQSVSLPNGETYAYLELGAKKAGQATLLLIHGNNSSSIHFLPVFRQLADSGVHVIAPDLRGFGDSSYEQPYNSIGELSDDIKMFTDALEISNVHIAGWSLGGGIAFDLALRYPEFVSSLFIIQGMSHRGLPYPSSASPYSSKEAMAGDIGLKAMISNSLINNAAFFEASWNATIYLAGNRPSAEDSAVYIAETIKQRCLIDSCWAISNFNLGNGSNGYVDGTNTIGLISCPVAFTRADKDTIINAAVVNANAAAIPGSVVLPYVNCAHSPMVDLPDTLTADILEFCKL